MNKFFRKTIAILITTCMCVTGTVCVAFADEASGSALATTTPTPTSNIITTSAYFTHKAYAVNTDKLGEIVQKDNMLTVDWHVEDPSRYSLFKLCRVNYETNGLKLIQSFTPTSKTDYSYNFPASGGKYGYAIKAYLASDPSQKTYEMSETADAPKVPENYLLETTVKTNLSWTAEAEKKIPLYKKVGGRAYTTVPKGTEMKATWKFAPTKFDFWSEPTWVQVKYKGKKLWAKWSKVDMHWHITHKDYAWSVKEKFVNNVYKGKSHTDYLIWVSRYAQRTNVFKKNGGKWRLIKVFDCNTGNYYQPLKGGQYYINGHEYRRDKIHRDGREYYFLYSTKFGGSGTFHTRCRWSDTNSLRNSIKRHPTTKGCDRLYDSAAQYVYGLPTGTGVVIK